MQPHKDLLNTLSAVSLSLTGGKQCAVTSTNKTDIQDTSQRINFPLKKSSSKNGWETDLQFKHHSYDRTIHWKTCYCAGENEVSHKW